MMIDAFRFHSPLWFVLAPLAIGAVAWAYHPRRRAAALFSSVAELRKLPVTTAQRLRQKLPYVYALGLLMMVVALARPQQGRSDRRIRTEGVAIEVVIDISGSMEALDFQLGDKQLSRIGAVKHVATEFVRGSKESGLKGRPNDLVGLVAFGGFADSKCPLTLDHGALTDILQSLQVAKPIFDKHGRMINEKTLAEESATAIGDGLSLGADRLRNVDAKSKVLILLTDGDNNAGVVEPHEAAKIAQKLGIKIYTICVGTNDPVPFPQQDAFGNSFLTTQVFPIDEKLLQDLAEIGSGKYYHAHDTDTLTKVYAEIDRMEKSKVEETRYTEYDELYHWPALAGIVLLFGVNVLSLTRFRSLP